MCAAIACQYSFFGDVNGVGVVEIDLCFVIHHSISGISKFAATEKSLAKGWAMSTMLVGAHTLCRSFASLVALAVPPVGRMNTLEEMVVVSSKGSWGAPAVEVAPVSLTVDAMDPFMMPCLRAVVDMDGFTVVWCAVMR